VLAGVLARLERERFTSPHLVALRAALEEAGRAPSRRIAELQRLVELRDSVRNQIFAPLAGLTLWTTQVAMAIEAWRTAHGAAVARWLRAVGEMEALGSLASRHFEHPEDVFPELLPAGPHFEAEGIAHPLLPERTAMRNDVRLDAEQRVLLVSGSNMSGKSTLLRSVGVNLVLALCGAPVRARRLVVSPLALGASIRVHDSLQAGESRFYAEIRRLRQIMDLARDRPPLLFLLDEVLHGTNSAERRVGAEAIVRGLLERGAVGLLTTHDLALAEIAVTLAPAARNVHFEDHLEDGRIAFDYRMRDGVVTRSNALALMRAVGLDV
jgi:DNA mismatch repair ATPase MutS